ncbi:MAG: DinB family protein, partial [Candidatus Hermodarchaeota archaeon]
SALDWPGWARSGRDELEALNTFLEYGPRYQRAIYSSQLNFKPPVDSVSFEVTERLTGNATTDFGAPGIAPSVDSSPMDTATLERFKGILNACWEVFAKTVGSANGKQLRKGPRGGGRSVSQIADHVIESHYNYLRMIYWREPQEKTSDVSSMIEVLKHADEQALAFAVSGEMPETGSRGGKLWKPRYFVRRAAWHILDHAWEIEDKLET